VWSSVIRKVGGVLGIAEHDPVFRTAMKASEQGAVVHPRLVENGVRACAAGDELRHGEPVTLCVLGKGLRDVFVAAGEGGPADGGESVGDDGDVCWADPDEAKRD